jgi:hypothetical protein
MGKRHSPEQIGRMLWQAEGRLASGSTVPELAGETTRRALDQTRALSAELKRLQQEELAGGMESAFEALLAESDVPDGVEVDLSFSGDESSIPKPVKCGFIWR